MTVKGHMSRKDYNDNYNSGMTIGRLMKPAEKQKRQINVQDADGHELN